MKKKRYFYAIFFEFCRSDYTTHNLLINYSLRDLCIVISASGSGSCATAACVRARHSVVLSWSRSACRRSLCRAWRKGQRTVLQGYITAGRSAAGNSYCLNTLFFQQDSAPAHRARDFNRVTRLHPANTLATEHSVWT